MGKVKKIKGQSHKVAPSRRSIRRSAHAILWRILVVAFCGAALSGSVSAKQKQDETPKLSLQIVVYNQAGVPQSVLDAAGVETIRIFRAAGINLSWTVCSNEATMGPESCRLDPDARLPLVLNVLRHAPPRSPIEICGSASLGEDRFGRYADLFLDQLELLHKLHGIDSRILLGTAAAHELGHLLLGSGAHSFIGIMKPLWNSEDLRRVGTGTLVFTPEQAELIRNRLRSFEMQTVTPATLASYRK